MNCKKGFTLIEIIIALAIVGILSATAALTFNSFKNKSILSAGFASASSLRASLITYACSSPEGSYPEKIGSWKELVTICRESGSTIQDSSLEAGFKDWIKYTPINPDGDDKIEDFTLLLRLTGISNTTPGSQIQVTSSDIIKQDY